MYSKVDKRYPIAIQNGTAGVPNDGKYHVVDNGDIVLSTAVLEYAELRYAELRESHRVAAGHPDPAEILARERAHKEMRALRAEGVNHQERRNRGKGPGGRGGV